VVSKKASGPRRKKASTLAVATEALCGCQAGEPAGGRAPLAVDPELKEAALTRLRRIEGQARGLQRMVAEERYCPEILAQMASVQAALRAVARSLMRNHLRHCVATAGGATAEHVYDDLLELIFKQSG
jgi:CsoR family transcriptional regulator, copper-sensing transcriptional repressor